MARASDDRAFAELYQRHEVAARAAARSLTRSRSDVDDLVAEAFSRVLQALRGGKGPEVAFRPYLLTCVRNSFYDRSRKDKRIEFTGELEETPTLSLTDMPESGEDRQLIVQAYTSLPERWQLALWHTEVEGRSAAEVGRLLGLAPNAVAALTYRAREGLRQAYLQAHLQRQTPAGCQTTRPNLGAYVRDGLSRRDRLKVEEHLKGCDGCKDLVVELQETNRHLRAVLIPLVLGVPAATYLGSLNHVHIGVRGRIRQAPRPTRLLVGATSAAASVAGTVVVSTYAGQNWLGRDGSRPVAAAVDTRVELPSPGSGSASDDPGGSGSPGTGDGGGSDGAPNTDPVVAPSDPPVSTLPPVEPSPAPTIAEAPPVAVIGPASSVAPTTSGAPTTSRPPAGSTVPVTTRVPPTTPPPTTPRTVPTTTGTTAVPTTAPPPTAVPTTVPTTVPPPTTVAAAPDMTIEISTGNTAIAGQYGYLTVAVRNSASGPNRVVGVARRPVVDVRLPAGVTLVGSSSWTCSPVATGASCALGDLAPGAASTDTLEVRVGPAVVGDVAIAAALTADPGGVRRTASMRMPVTPAGTTSYARIMAGGLAVTGNGVMTCVDTDQCAEARTGTATGTGNARHDHFIDHVDVDGDPSTFNSSTAQLVVPAGSTIEYALLAWSGDTAAGSGGQPAPEPTRRGSVRFTTPAGPVVIAADRVREPAAGSSAYYATADVTALVRSGGVFGVADVQSGTGRGLNGGRGRYGGWSLIVAYRSDGATRSMVRVEDGLVTPTTRSATVSVADPFRGRPASGPIGIAWLAFEGDLSSVREQVTLNGQSVTDPANPSDDLFNSTIEARAQLDPAFPNTFGTDADLLEVTVPGDPASYDLFVFSPTDLVRLGAVGFVIPQ